MKYHVNKEIYSTCYTLISIVIIIGDLKYPLHVIDMIFENEKQI
jgi:hypothetical protein